MRKIIFTLMFAVLSGAWSVVSATCMASVSDDTTKTARRKNLSQDLIPSLCDTWNMLSDYGAMLPPDEHDYNTYIEQLAADTIISTQRYVRLLSNGRYKGAMREGDNSNIYYIPAGDNHEFLLYSFNAQTGDTLNNLWIGGGTGMELKNGYKGIITSITQEYPRIYNIDIYYTIVDDYGEYPVKWQTTWKEGIGLPTGPAGDPCVGVPGCACSCNRFMLCAYKNNEQVYASEASKTLGCNYEHSQPRLQHFTTLTCDEWHIQVLPFADPTTQPKYYTQRLTTDTLIGERWYRQLHGGTYIHETDNAYLGALREQFYNYPPKDPSKPKYRKAIFYIPVGTTSEYLLYDFNAEVGDTLRNLWIGSGVPGGCTAVVTNISGNPQRFDLDVIGLEGYFVHWLEGIGGTEGPIGSVHAYYGAADPVPELLCACNDGSMVYKINNNCECDNLQLKYLCDTWNIHEVAFPDGYDQHYMFVQKQTTDTLIAGTRYVRLEQNGGYLGALRETDNARIYFVPAGSAHEYLLYAFHANPGDTFENVWFGGLPSDFPNGCKVTIREITVKNGRKVFGLDVKYALSNYDDPPIWPYYSWIEGVGLPQGPVGHICPFDCAGDFGQSVLCAYKDGVQVYASAEAEISGCWFDSNEQTGDTIQLYKYAGDDPGSSTVDPVDPNQVVVILKDDQLTIRESSGEEITYSLQMNAQANAPARSYAQQEDSFRDLITIRLTENGTYTLQLTNPQWGYSLVGTFVYGTDGIDSTTLSETSAQKIIRDGKMLIMRGDKVYSLTGIQVE